MVNDETDVTRYRELLANPVVTDYENLIDLLMEDLFAERGCMWLEREGAFIYRGDENLRAQFPFSRQAVTSVLDEGRGFLCADPQADARILESGSIALNQVRSCLCAAAFDKDSNVLVLAYFDNQASIGNFRREDLSFLRRVLGNVPGAVPTFLTKREKSASPKMDSVFGRR